MGSESADRDRRLEIARLALTGRLVASFTHQMSTPLAAISLRVDGLSTSVPAPPDKLARYLRAMAEETRRCQDLLAALREFGGPSDLAPRPLDLGSICRRAAILVRDEATRRQIELETDLPPELPPVTGSRSRLGQLLLSLLAEAVEHCPAGGRVALRMETGANQLQVAIATEPAPATDEATSAASPEAAPAEPVAVFLDSEEAGGIAAELGGRLAVQASAPPATQVLLSLPTAHPSR